MSRLWDRWKRWLGEPLVPAAAFAVTGRALGGARAARRDRSIAAASVRPLVPGLVEPSFDRPNIVQPAAFDSALRDLVRRLGPAEGPVALLLPETCVKTALLTFENLPAAPAERERIIRWRLAKILPLRPAKTRLSFDVFRENGRVKAFCALASEPVAREYEEAFARAGLKTRMIGIPTIPLLGLLPPSGPLNRLVVNVEDDHLAVLAILGGEPALFRVKSFAPDAAPIREQTGTEIETALRYLEDREHKTVEAVWIRPAASGWMGAEESALPGRGIPVRMILAGGPAGATVAERAFLAPLYGQLS